MNFTKKGGIVKTYPYQTLSPPVQCFKLLWENRYKVQILRRTVQTPRPISFRRQLCTMLQRSTAVVGILHRVYFEAELNLPYSRELDRVGIRVYGAEPRVRKAASCG